MPEVWDALQTVRRLDFRQPPFCRVAWVSESARKVWQPKIQQIVRAQPRIFAESALAKTAAAIPPCCSTFRRRVRELWNVGDTTLAKALNTPGATLSNRVVRLSAQPLSNTLLYPFGIQLLSHDPCSMSCAASQHVGAAWVDIGRHFGYADQMDALEEMLSWPMEWSALHGIAEIKTPIAKISTNTDATADTYRVQLLSDRYPAEGVAGLRFPFQQPRLVRIANPRTGPIASAKVAGAEASNDRGPAPLSPKPRCSVILDETFELVRRDTTIKSIYLSNYFNVIQLDDLSTGAAMNYCRFKSDSAIQHAHGWLTAKLASDPLLLSYLFPSDEPDLLQLSLKTCLVSALSKKGLSQTAEFQSQTSFDPNFFPDVGSAVVIGFGGYMDYVILMTNTERIHISDLDYPRRADRMERRLAYYRERFPHKTITISGGSDTQEQLAQANMVSITGSAFSTGTMEGLLEAARNCQTIIVQGQSASIHPVALFRRGVNLVSTTIKPDNLLQLANSDTETFKSLLEGKLPPHYFRPHHATAS